MDVLADVLTVLAVEAVFYYRATFSAPFSIAIPAERRHIRFHLGCRGKPWIGLPGGNSAVLGPGDLILVPHGSAHILADGPNTPPLPLDDMLKQARSERLGCIAYGGSGQSVELVCGHFGFNEEIVHPLIESLPALIHVKAAEHQEYVWLDVVFQQMDKESRVGLPGHQEVLRRLSEIVFIQILRAFAREGSESARFLTALVDPQLRRVLDAIHADPSSDWTIERLAEVAGMSRTLFAERFRTKLGVTPMRYVADWRLQKARALLAEPSLTVGEIARAVGYGSESSFNRAFSQHFGRTPGAGRKGPER
jgi:AraC-like DNA-binding protein